MRDFLQSNYNINLYAESRERSNPLYHQKSDPLSAKETKINEMPKM